jgi:hypothetical protein
MLKNLKNYVSFDILNYLAEIETIIPKHPDFCFQQTLDYILPSIFLKMTGCLEHKIDMITMQLCIDNEQLKQNVLRQQSSIPSGSSALHNVIARVSKCSDYFNGKINISFKDNDNTKICGEKGLWKNEKPEYTKCKEKLKNLIEEIGLDKYIKLPYEEHNVKTIKLKEIYDKANQYRNNFAHNENSVYSEEIRPNKLNNENTVFDSWWYRFLIVSYVDGFIRKSFADYLNVKKRHSCY